MFRLAFAVAALASMASGHLTISSPKPFPGMSKNPLNPSGSNFPCQGVARGSEPGTPMKAGSAQKLIFDGGPTGFNTAVHGGGSCQISITYETDSNKLKDPANWRVIKSIEEGCPTNSHLNLDGSYDGPQGTYTGSWQCSDPKTNGVDCLNVFDYDLPEDLPSGQATIAWTWFNNVGNREMYMNCAAAEIEGGSDNSDYLNNLPQMFVANLAGINQCASTESVSVKFPNPGPQLEVKKPTPKQGFTAQFSDYAAQIPQGEGCDDNSGGNAGPSTTEIPSSPPTSAAPAPSSSGFSTSFTTQMSTITAPTPGPSAGPGGNPGGNGSTGNGGNSGNGGSSGGNCQYPCSTEGAIMCLPGNKWGMCAHGCAEPQDVAAGMQCANGAMEAVAGRKRHPHGIAHRRSGAKVF